MSRVLKNNIDGFAKRVVEQRKKLGMTRVELGRRIGLTTTGMRFVEEGTRLPSLPVAMRLAAALGISLSKLLGEK